VLAARRRLIGLENARPRRVPVPDTALWLAGSVVVALLALGLALVLRAWQ
jgi:hypothetical protein